MKIATFVYQHYLTSTGARRKAWAFIRMSLIKTLRDPICSLPIHGKYLKLPLSHSLPIYLNQHPFYDQLPRRISEYIHQKQENLTCIDVGANIGDTIAAFCKDDKDKFLAIEPNSSFNKLLTENWAKNKNVNLVTAVCSSGSDKKTFAIKEKDGTATILPSENGEKLITRSLDEIARDYSFCRKTNVLKIDTDGYDFEVIQGAKSLLSRCLPIVLFECDVFEDTDYIENCIEILRFLRGLGYKHFLLYDNFGHLMGKYSLLDISPFRNLLFFQLTSTFCYFDILIMKDEDLFKFYKGEIDYFAETMPNKQLQRTAISAVEL